jgi:hypothetical protein
MTGRRLQTCSHEAQMADITLPLDFSDHSHFLNIASLWEYGDIHYTSSYKNTTVHNSISDTATVTIVAAEFNILACYQSPTNSDTPPLFPLFLSSSSLPLAMVFKQEVVEAFETLGIPVDADRPTAMKAYKRLALIHHPDRNHGDSTATLRFQQVLSLP